MTDWRKLEAELVYWLRKQDCDIEEDEMDDLTTRYVNVTQLAQALVDRVEFKPKAVVLQQDENAGIP